MSDSLWYYESTPKRHASHGSRHVQSYSTSYSNINGKESESTQKYVASQDSNGRRHGKLFRERKQGLDKRSYTRQLTDREVEHTLNYRGNLDQNVIRPYRHTDSYQYNSKNHQPLTQNRTGNSIQPYHQPDISSDNSWSNLDSLDILSNTMHSQPFTNFWKNDPFFTDS